MYACIYLHYTDSENSQDEDSRSKTKKVGRKFEMIIIFIKFSLKVFS